METKKSNVKTTIPYSASDLGLAAYLQALGGHFVGVDRNDPREMVFMFELSVEQYDAISKYNDGTGQVSALAYYNAYQGMKRSLGRKNHGA